MTSAGCRCYAVLGRVRISSVAALSAMVGYLLAAFSIRTGMFISGMGVFLLSCSASALNQYQERDIDARMERTKSRPLPSAMLSGREALLFAGVCASAGFPLIFFAGGIPAFVGGLFAIAWYNGLYTNLKKITAFAAVPGALVGAVTPLIGWTSGGGSLTDPALFVLCLFFFLWQVPHFWLFSMHCKDQYRDAGLPSITSVFSEAQLSRIVFIWIVSAAVSALLFVPYGVAFHPVVGYLLAVLSLLLVFQGAKLLTRKEEAIWGRVFGGINLYLLTVMVLLFVDRIFS